MSNITLNIVEPGSAPIEPVVPNTGLFTSGIGGAETAIIATISLVVILAIIIAVLYYRNKKQGKLISLKHSKATTMGLTTLALLVSIGTVAGLLKLGASAVDDSLTVTTSSEELTIELADEPIFAALPVELTVAEATQAGYTLTAYTEDTDLVSTTDSSNVIPMVVADEGELTTLTDNTYGLALVEPEDKDSEVYTALSTDADIPTILAEKEEATEANDTTIVYYGFYITPDVPYGTYTGSNINYQANPNYITNLAFNGNGSDGGTAIEGMTIIAGDTITLPANTYTKEGYSFTGWNTVATPTTEDPGVSYADEAEFTASLTQSEDITLYAQWEEDILYMQDVAKWGSNLQIGDEVIAVDSRDGKEYYVARLADNNIWMTQNLDFNIVDGGADLNSANTDVPAGWADAGHLANTYSASVTTWNDSGTAPESYDPGNLYWNGNLNSSWNGTLNNMTSSTGNPHYHIGNYYNWTAAVAMNDSSLYTGYGQNVNQSICPAGWRLPVYSSDKSYQNLVNMQGLTSGTSGNIQSTPVYFVYSGNWNGSSSHVGSRGSYWSSATESVVEAFQLYFLFNGNLSPYTDVGRGAGYPLRCVAQ